MRRSTFFAMATLIPLTLNAETAITFRVVDSTGQPSACRIHLVNEAGQPQRAPGQPFFRDHFVCSGEAKWDLPKGTYSYEIEKGPEFRRASGEFTIADEPRSIAVTLERLIDMSSRSWWSGDLHIHRPIEQTPLHLVAEDLHIAPVITWWNGRNHWRQNPHPDSTLISLENNRYYDVMAGEDERDGGALLYFGLKKPLQLPGGRREFPEFPSPIKFVLQAREKEGAHIDIEKPFWWDVPVWLASGKIDSIGLANNHMCRSTMYANEAWGRPRDVKRLPPPRGNGFWTQEIYYHILNAGLRVPPSAGSASGVLPNPVGYNRAYVQVDGELSYEKWWQGLRAGRSFVTNGPLLICEANGRSPGEIHKANSGETVQLELELELHSNDAVPEIEIIQNGKAIKSISVEELPMKTTETVEFRESGWVLVRAITEKQRTFRFASTAPFYVEFGDSPRISKRSVQFFLDWVEERIKQIEGKLTDENEREEVLKHHLSAKEFWRSRLSQATAE